jgi:hypothetical protein
MPAVAVGQLARHQAARHTAQCQRAGQKTLPPGREAKLQPQKGQGPGNHGKIEAEQIPAQGRNKGNADNVG